MNMIHMTKVEMGRALHRRLVRWLIVIALAGCAAAGLIVFFSSTEHLSRADSHPAFMRDWWRTDGGESFLSIGAVFLAIGAAIGGASVAGAEWAAGTITTVLTWEPSRLRLHLARTSAAAILAFVIAFVLQVVFLALSVPAVAAHGSTAGTDWEWWQALVLAMVRISLVSTLLAVLALSVATIGRNTAAALASMAAWALVLENLIRGLRPGFARVLIGESVGTVVPWKAMEGVEFHRPPVLALVTLMSYLGVVVAASTAVFCRRDIGSG